MKFLRIITLMLCLAMLLPAVFGAAAAAEGTFSSCRGIDADKPLGGSEKILETAQAVVLYERTSGTMIYGYNLDAQIYPSSMVKLMTALVALQNGDLDTMVTVTRSALDNMGVGVVSVSLVRGEEMSLRDLLYCLMVASANDAAVVIAEHIGGSQSGFVAMMNEMAVEMGLRGTHFSNAHGLHDEGTYTTARDVLRILDIALNNPEFKTMFETVSYTVPATNKTDARELESTNKMMESGSKYYDERVTGGKTGATDQAGRCLAITAQVGDMEMIGIVMGAKAEYSADGSYLTRYGSFEEMAQLLDYGQDGFECCQLFYENQVIAQYPVINGSNNVVTTPADGAFSVVPKGITAEELTWRYETQVTGLTAPIEKGQSVSVMEVWYGDICLARTDLVAMNSVAVHTPLTEDRITGDEQVEQKHGKVLAMILGVLVGIVALFMVGLVLVRLVRTALLKARVRRRRRNRRRNRNARME